MLTDSRMPMAWHILSRSKNVLRRPFNMKLTILSKDLATHSEVATVNYATRKISYATNDASEMASSQIMLFTLELKLIHCSIDSRDK